MLPIVAQTQTGASENKQKRTIRIGLYFTNTWGQVKVGTTLDSLQMLYGDEGNAMSETEENTGMYYANIEEDFSDVAGQLYIVHEHPYPVTLLSATRRVELRD